MFLSVIVTIWNDEKYLEECLDSVLNNDLPSDDYEIICVDDGSTDRTPEMLKQYAERFPNIRIITKQHGVAYGYGRVIGFREVRGDYIWFVDHDDVVAPHALDILKEAVQSADGFDRISFPYYEFFEELTEKEREGMEAGTLRSNSGTSLLSYALWSGIISSSFMRKNQIEPHSRRVAAAGQYWGIENLRAWGGDNICLEECFDCGMRTKHLDGLPLYYYRRSNNSQTMNMQKTAVLERRQMRYHTALVRGYIAIQMKAKYESERKQYEAASADTTVAMILKIRNAVLHLNKLPHKEWKKGLLLFCEKDLFFRKKPEEYKFSLSDYLKTRTWKERLNPFTYAYYYLYHPFAARILRLLTVFGRMAGSDPFIVKAYRRHKQKRLALNAAEQFP